MRTLYQQCCHALGYGPKNEQGPAVLRLPGLMTTGTGPQTWRDVLYLKNIKKGGSGWKMDCRAWNAFWKAGNWTLPLVHVGSSFSFAYSILTLID